MTQVEARIVEYEMREAGFNAYAQLSDRDYVTWSVWVWKKGETERSFNVHTTEWRKVAVMWMLK